MTAQTPSSSGRARGDSPLSALLQRRVLAADRKAMRARMGFQIGEQFLNRQGVLHGGAIATMLDTLCGFALWVAAERRFGQTLELKTHFLRPAFPGAYHGEGRVVRMGRSIAFLEAELFDAQDMLVATASATFRLRSRQPAPKSPERPENPERQESPADPGRAGRA